MRTMLAITVLILLTSTVSGCIGKNDIGLNLDDEEPTPLRINHIQMKGTHN
jgi:hypothetical protein